MQENKDNQGAKLNQPKVVPYETATSNNENTRSMKEEDIKNKLYDEIDNSRQNIQDDAKFNEKNIETNMQNVPTKDNKA
jgi:hypothetical protein